MKINSTTNIICLLGHPIKHSFSPEIHNYLFEKYNQNKVYVCFDIEERNLNKTVEGIKAMGILGSNITIPHKVDILKYIDNVDNNAKLIGAVNTIKNEGGILIGYNTDGIGFVKSITDKGHKLEGKKVMIIGAGGACRSIAVELASSNVLSIEIRNRSLENAKEIVDTVKSSFDVEITCSTKSIDKSDIENVDILINTTPIGMENNLCPIDENIKVSKSVLICDIVYKPHNTTFIKWAKANGLDVVYGIDMLINQGIYAFYIWTGIQPTIEDVAHIKDIYQKKNNIVFD
ncbi:MAG: shikimate dehydrogenase [Peptostreptococcaceae bacterium]